MIRHKWTIRLRNQLTELAMECDSCAAIEGAKLTSTERSRIQNDLRKVVDYIDKQLKA